MTRWVRSERLAEDISAAFGLRVPPSDGRRRVNATRHDYVRDPAFWFTAEELAGLYAANPLWARLEAELYGGLLTGPALETQGLQSLRTSL